MKQHLWLLAFQQSTTTTHYTYLRSISSSYRWRSIQSISSSSTSSPPPTTTRIMSSSTDNVSTINQTKKQLVVDPFCFRQFAEHEASKTYGETVFQLSVSELEDIANRCFHMNNGTLQDGYAPFCKHLFIENDFATTTTSNNSHHPPIRVKVLPTKEF